jgi:hypothetical protein
MRPDNINGNMTNPQSWNLYSYVHGNPVRNNDPMGHGANTGQVGSSESQHPGAFPDYGLSTWWLHEVNGLGTVMGDSAARLINLFKSTEKPTLGLGQSGGSRSYWGDYSLTTNPQYMQSPAPSANLQSVLPDFISFSVNLPIPTPWTFAWLGIGVGGSISRYGTVYFSPGIQVGKSFMGVPGVSLTPGYLNQRHVPSEFKLDSFLSGNSYNVMGGFGIGLGEAWTPGSGFGTVGGLVTFPFGGSWTYSFDVWRAPLRW